MTEQEKPVETKTPAVEIDIKGKSGQENSWTIAASILLGSVIIAGSILYSFNMLRQSLDVNNVMSALSKGVGQQLQQLGQAAPSAPTAAVPSQPAVPTGPINVNPRASAPVEGSKNAAVTMVEFGDFQCPYCQSFFQTTLPDIKSKYIDTGKVKLIFRHFPLPFHVNAQIAAVAAECANQQGQFWAYHDLLYKNGQGDGTNLDKASLEKYAGSLGLNNGLLGFGSNKFNKCLESNATLPIVQADTKDGTAAGVSGTPTFYINGKQIIGAQPASVFEQAIESSLKS